MCASMSTAPSLSSTATAVTRPSGPSLTCVSSASRSGTDMALPFHDPAIGGEALEAHGAARVQLVGGDADFRAEAVLAAVREARGGVDHQRGAVDAGQESLLRRRGFGDDGVSVVGAVLVDVRYRAGDAVDHLHGQDEIEVFLVPIGLGGGLHGGNQGAHGLVAAQLHVVLGER